MDGKDEYQTVTADTKRLLDGQEGRQVDFKLDPRAIDAEDLVAFANASGGTILAGVSELETDEGIQRGQVEGCSVDDDTRQVIVGKASSCRPAVDLRIRIENARTKSPILRIDIPEGSDKPYSTGGGVYKIRSEARNVPIGPELMKATILESEADQFIERFRHAAQEVVEELQKVESELSGQIEVVDSAARIANESAHRAEAAAHEAIDAAYQAAEAAEIAAGGGY